MGLTISSLFGQVFGKKPVRILMVGLDGVGKTTILNKLCDKVVTTIPTIGFNVERVDYGNISFTVWDMGGQDIIRPLRRHYYEGVQAIIFVVDSNDRERIFQVFNEYDQILEEEELRDVIVLVFANKQDLSNAMSPKYLSSLLSPRSWYSRRKWHLQSACATQGHGLYEGLSWLSSNVS